MKKDEIKTSPKEGEEILIKASSEKLKFWRPTKIGDSVQGKLVAISEGNFGKMLKLKTQKGIIGVNIGAFLEDIDFIELQEQEIKFSFAGTVGKRGMKIYDVSVLKPKDEVPF